jgi:hypothetical protein
MTNVGGEPLNVWFEEKNSSFYISGIVDYYCLNIISMQYNGQRNSLKDRQCNGQQNSLKVRQYNGQRNSLKDRQYNGQRNSLKDIQYNGQRKRT